MEIESFSSSYIQKNDINATIQRFKACVSLVLMFLNYKSLIVHLNNFNLIILIVD